MGGPGSGGFRYTLKRPFDPKKTTKLPRECTAAVPEWPDTIENPNLREINFWTTLWGRPQAHIWHNEKSYDSVALYVRLMVESGKPRASAQTRIAVRQMADILLINAPALSSQGYVITNDSEADVMVDGVIPLAATGTDGGARAGTNRVAKSSRSRMNARVVPIRDDSE